MQKGSEPRQALEGVVEKAIDDLAKVMVYLEDFDPEDSQELLYKKMCTSIIHPLITPIFLHSDFSNGDLIGSLQKLAKMRNQVFSLFFVIIIWLLQYDVDVPLEVLEYIDMGKNPEEYFANLTKYLEINN